MKVITALIISILFGSCGSPFLKHVIKHKRGVTRQFSTTNSIFLPFVEEFKNAHTKTHGSKISVGHIPINFGSPSNDSFVAVCHIYYDGSKEILIRKDKWEQFADGDKRLTIFHELGHCYLDRAHKNDKIVNECEEFNTSIMSATLMPSTDYKKYQSLYDKELFTKNHEPLKETLNSPHYILDCTK
jgi:hypothetical protein